MGRFSSGEIARLAGWTSLLGLVCTIVSWFALSSLRGAFLLVGILLAPFIWLAELATVLGALVALLCGMTSLVSGRDRVDAAIGLGAAVPALLVIGGIVFLIIVFTTTSQSFFG